MRTERIPGVIVAAALVLFPATVPSQTPHWPSAEDIARVQRATPFPDPEQIRSQPVPRPPVTGTAKPALDLEALARAGVAVREAAAPNREIPLRIFVTLALPKETLQLLASQAERAGAVLVLRGLAANSMRRTAAAVQEIAGERRVGWLIDPEAFTRFGVTHAPAFVLSLNGAGNASSCASAACTPEARFLAIAGDVSLGYALEAMQRRRPETAGVIAPILRRLRGS